MSQSYREAVTATQKAMEILGLTGAFPVEFEDDPVSGSQSITLDGWVKLEPSSIVQSTTFRDANSESPAPIYWNLYILGEKGERLRIDEDTDPIELVKSAVLEVMSGRARDILDEVFGHES